MRTVASNSLVSPCAWSVPGAGSTLTVTVLGGLAGRELERDDAHADEVGAVDALVGLGDDRLDAQQGRALGRPVARRARAVLDAAEDHQRRPGGQVVLRG